MSGRPSHCRLPRSLRLLQATGRAARLFRTEFLLVQRFYEPSVSVLFKSSSSIHSTIHHAGISISKANFCTTIAASDRVTRSLNNLAVTLSSPKSDPPVTTNTWPTRPNGARAGMVARNQKQAEISGVLCFQGEAPAEQPQLALMMKSPRHRSTFLRRNAFPIMDLFSHGVSWIFLCSYRFIIIAAAFAYDITQLPSPASTQELQILKQDEVKGRRIIRRSARRCPALIGRFFSQSVTNAVQQRRTLFLIYPKKRRGFPRRLLLCQPMPNGYSTWPAIMPPSSTQNSAERLKE